MKEQRDKELLDKIDLTDVEDQLEFSASEVNKELSTDVLYISIDSKTKDYWKELENSFHNENDWKKRIQKCAKQIVHATCLRESTLNCLNKVGGGLMQFIGYYLSIYHLCVAILSMDYRTNIRSISHVTDHKFIERKMEQSFIEEAGFKGIADLIKCYKALMKLREEKNYHFPMYDRKKSEDLFPALTLSIFNHCIKFFKTLSDYMSTRFSRNQLSFNLWKELLEQIKRCIEEGYLETYLSDVERLQAISFLINQDLIVQIQSNPQKEGKNELQFVDRIDYDLSQPYIQKLGEMEDKIVDQREFPVFSKEWKKKISWCAFRLLQAISYREYANTLHNITKSKVLPTIGFYYALYYITLAILSLEKTTTLKSLSNVRHSDLIRKVGGTFINDIIDKNTNQQIPYKHDLETLLEMRNLVIYVFPNNFYDISKCYDVIGNILDFAFDYINKVDRVLYKRYNLLLKEEIDSHLKEKIKTGYINDYLSNTVLVNVKTYLRQKFP